MTTSKHNYDIVIIGAGISGLSAARHLQKYKAGMSLVVLEAMDRVGGRTQSVEVVNPQGKTDHFDMGAHWVCTTQPDILETMQELGIEHYPQNIKGTKVLQVGDDNKVTTYGSLIPSLKNKAALLDLQLLIDLAEEMCKKTDVRDPYYSSDLAEELDSMTLESFIRQKSTNREIHDIMGAAVRASMGCDPNQISALFWFSYCNAGGGMMRLLTADPGAAQELRVKGGTQTISKRLRDKIGRDRVRLNCPVASIEQHCDGHTVVTTKDGTEYVCQHVITSAPVTQMLKWRFSPPICQARRSLWTDLRMGSLMKVFVFYETPFWLKAGFSGEVVAHGGTLREDSCDYGPVCVTYDATTYQNTPVLVGFIAGKAGDQWFSRTQEDRKRAVIAQLVTYFGECAAHPTRYMEKNWREEEYTGGGPAIYGTPGCMHNFRMLRAPHGNVYFAGTDTATQWCGYMSGAVQAGKRAAAQVMHEINPSLLTPRDRKAIADANKTYPKPEKQKRAQTPFFSTAGGRCVLIFTILVAIGGALAGGYFWGRAVASCDAATTPTPVPPQQTEHQFPQP